MSAINLKSKKRNHILHVIIVFMIAFCMIWTLLPPPLEADAADQQYNLFLNGTRISNVSAYYINGTAYVPCSIIGSKLKNAGITEDKAGNRLVVDMTKQNLLLSDTSITNYIKTNAPRAYIPTKTINSATYFPLNVLKSFFKVKYSVGSSSIAMTTADDKVKLAQINKNAVKAVRSLKPVEMPSVLAEPEVLSLESELDELDTETQADQSDGSDSPSADPDSINTSPQPQVSYVIEPVSEQPEITLYTNDIVTILKTYDNYYKAELSDGTQCYIYKQDVTISDVNLANVDFYSAKKKKFTPGGKLSINWEYVNLAQNGATPETPASKLAGLDVLCPIWFAFTDSNGNVKNVGDKGYTDSAHAKGYKVWATVTNSFDGSMTTTVLGNKTLRDKVIAQYLLYSLIYDVDGVNIDFENVKDADGPKLTTFVSEMRAYTEKLGLSLSIDVMVPRSWNAEYEYGKLHKYVDYIAMMSYDEYYSGSKSPGPIASLPWVEDNVKRILKEGVPASKVLLGVPTYTRIWTVDASDNVTKNSAYSMKSVRDIVSQKGLTPTWLDDKKLYYTSYTEDGALKKVWLEDSRSISHKLALVQSYNLAGAATWRRGFEEPAVWNVYAGMLKNGAAKDAYQKAY